LTRTVQSRSFASLNEAGKNQTTGESETDDDMSLLLSICDSLNNLCDRLNKLGYLLKQKKLNLDGE